MDLKLYNERVAQEKAKEAQCRLLSIPGSTKVYYVSVEDGEKSTWSVNGDGSERMKLDVLSEYELNYFLVTCKS